MEVKKIDHICIAVKNLEEAKKVLNPQETGVSVRQMLEALSPEGIKKTLGAIRRDAGLEDTETDPDQPSQRNKPRFK